MASENSPEDELFQDRLRAFGSRRFGTMAALAESLGMKPPALQGYLSGRRNPGVEMLKKLSALGFDARSEIDSPSGESKSHPILPTIAPDLGDVLTATRRTVDSLARQVHATADEVNAWMSGTTAPSYEQLAAILHLVVPVALAHCDHGTQRPESVLPATGTNG